MKTTPYRMTPDVIRNEVIKGIPGAYVLGDMEDGEFRFKYVGRSDSCLQTRLLTHDYLYEYSYFIFAYTADAKKPLNLNPSGGTIVIIITSLYVIKFIRIHRQINFFIARIVSLDTI